MCRPDDLRWADLSDTAKEAIRDLAELFHDGGTYEVKIVVHNGGKRDMKLGMDPDSWRGQRNNDP